jgi:hypothetical protein
LTEKEIAADEIDFVEIYKGVGLHDCQSPTRLAVVRAAIDFVASTNKVQELYDYCKSPANPPEARAFAGEKILAHLRHAGNRRRPAGITRERVLAHTAGLSCRLWRDPDHYCSLLDSYHMPGTPQPVKREVRLPE